MSISTLGAKIYAQPEEAKALILEEFIRAKGDRQKAAKLLGTTHRTFYRYVEKLRMWDALDAAVEKHGFTHIPGPPRSSEKIKAAVVLMKGDLTRAARTLDLRPGVLETRIEELNLWDELNATLKASKLRPLVRPKKAS